MLYHSKEARKLAIEDIDNLISKILTCKDLTFTEAVRVKGFLIDHRELIKKEDEKESNRAIKDLYGANSYAIKARQKLAKIVKKEMIKKRKYLAGAYMDGDKQVICNAYYGVAYNEPIEDIEKVEDEGNKLKFINLYNKIRNGYDFSPMSRELENINIDTVAIEQIIKQAKKDKDKRLILCKISDGYFNAQYLTLVLSTLTGNYKFYKAVGDKKTICIEADNGFAMICPISSKDFETLEYVTINCNATETA